jgi:hypothetical protein
MRQILKSFIIITGNGVGGGNVIPPNALLWDDGTPVLWDDGTYILWE